MKHLIIVFLFLFSLQSIAQPVSVQFPVLYTADDADEVVEDNLMVNPGDMQLDNPELEMNYDDNLLRLCHVVVGIRFANVTIPQGASIYNAYIQFTSKQTGSDIVNIIINGQNSNNPASFATSSGNISARPLTSASVNWMPSGWYTTDEADADQRTPDLTSVVQEIVNRSGWVSGNALAFMVSGTGASRSAYAYEGDPAKSAVLHVQYSPVGISENTLNINAVITPNPTSGFFSLKINGLIHDNISFNIYNQVGSEVNTYSFTDHHDGAYTFDISGLPSGLYFLNVRTSNENITKKILIN